MPSNNIFLSLKSKSINGKEYKSKTALLNDVKDEKTARDDNNMNNKGDALRFETKYKIINGAMNLEK